MNNDSPQRQTQVNEQMLYIATQIERANKAKDILVDRLASVLIQPCVGGASKAEEEIEKELTPFANELRKTANNISELATYLENIASRLEI